MKILTFFGKLLIILSGMVLFCYIIPIAWVYASEGYVEHNNGFYKAVDGMRLLIVFALASFSALIGTLFLIIAQVIKLNDRINAYERGAYDNRIE